MLTSLGNANTTSIQASFMALVPRIESQARIYFRGIKCATKKADYIAEVVAICWRSFCRLVKKGRDAGQFIGALASLASRAVWSGRRIYGQERSNDVMSAAAQRRYGFVVMSLKAPRNSYENLYSPTGQRLQDVMEDCLADDTTTPPPEQAAFRIDFPKWLGTLTSRERRIILAMAQSERTKELSRQFSVTPGRISQMRQQFKDGWEQYCGDGDENVA